MSKKVIDWEGIEKTYINTELPVRAIAVSYDVNHSTIIKKAKKLGWMRIFKSNETTKKVTKTISTDVVNMMGDVTSDDKIIDSLRSELDGAFSLLFFDVIRSEMSKKYYTYDYFSVFIAAEYFQRLMDVRGDIPNGGVATSSKSLQTYVSGEFNVFVSAASNFIKVTKDLGLSPLSRGRATLKVVEEMQTQSLFDFSTISDDGEIDV